MKLSIIAPFFLLLMFGNTVQAITGFAGTLLIMPFLLVFVGRETAVPTVNFLGLFMTVYMAIREKKHIQWKEIAIAFPWLALGILTGTFLQGRLNESFLQKSYGVVILVCVGILLWSQRSGGRSHFHSVFNGLLLVSSGVLHALFASGGPMLVLYMMGQIPEKHKFRATMSAVWITTNVTLGVQHFLAGCYTPEFLRMQLVLAPAVALGTLLGYCLYPRVSAEMFRKLSYVLLVIAGIYSIVF